MNVSLLVPFSGSALVHIVAVAVLFSGEIWGRGTQSVFEPIEVEIIFEDELLELAPSALLENLDALVEETQAALADEGDLAVLEAVVADDFDPLFLPDSSEFDGNPEGLEAYIETIADNSNLNADLSEDMVSTDQVDRGPANDQFPRGGDLNADVSEAEDSTAGELETEPAAPEPAEPEPEPEPEPESEPEPEPEPETLAEAEPQPAINLPLIPKPRPRAAPQYRDLAAEQREANAEASAELAAVETDTDTEAASADPGAESAADASTGSATTGMTKTEQEKRMSGLVQQCIGPDWSYPNFIENPLSWQATFSVEVDADGNLLSVEDGVISYPVGATRMMVEVFRDVARDTLYSCETYENLTKDTGEPLSFTAILAPRATVNVSN